MDVNQLPAFERTANPIRCCPRFQPALWERQELHFDNKPFVRASTIALFHVPLNMGSVYAKTMTAIQKAHAEGDGFLVMSHEDSPWHASHLFAVNGDVPGADMVRLSGTFLTQVFDGPFSEAHSWCNDMAAFANESGKQVTAQYFFYTTCPRCAKAYGHNYVVGLAQVS